MADSTRCKLKPNKKRISHVSENCPWVSEKTSVYTRMTTQQVLTMAFIYADRRMDFSRYTDKISNAVKKIDVILAEETNNKPLSDRRNLLLTGKEIFGAISDNFNTYTDDGAISLVDFTKKNIKKLMYDLVEEKENHVSCSDSDSNDTRSSEDQIHKEYEPHFERIINEYFATGEKTRLQNRIEQYLHCDERDMELNCVAFRCLIDYFKNKVTNSTQNRMKNLDYLARLYFVQVAQSTLRQASSSSHLERKFAEGTRTLDGKRVKLTVEHIASEVFLKSLQKEKQSLEALAQSLGHESKCFDRLMSTLDSFVDENDEFGDVSLIFYGSNNVKI